MKKLAMLLLIIVSVLFTSAIAFAATEKDVLDFIKAPYTINGVTKSVSQVDIVRAERFLADNKFTADEYSQILARMNEMLSIMQAEGQIDPTSMTWQSEHRFLTLANEIAAITHTTIKYTKSDTNHGQIIVYDINGKVLDQINYTENNFYKSTGSSDVLFLLAGLLMIGAFAGLKYKTKESFTAM